MAGSEDIETAPSIPEITAIAIMALAAGNDPLNTRRVAINYLAKTRQEDGSFVSNTPIELTEPTANLQSTCSRSSRYTPKQQMNLL